VSRTPYAKHIVTYTRMMYAAPNRRTTHRLAALDVPPPTIMRAPGEAQGMFALESAMDEMAIACRLDPVEFWIRNEPAAHPESGPPFSSRNLVSCLREGARRFGWQPRDPALWARRDRALAYRDRRSRLEHLGPVTAEPAVAGSRGSLRGAAPLPCRCGSAPPTSTPARHSRRAYQHPAAAHRQHTRPRPAC
jgi:hypothetical protein